MDRVGRVLALIPRPRWGIARRSARAVLAGAMAGKAWPNRPGAVAGGANGTGSRADLSSFFRGLFGDTNSPIVERPGYGTERFRPARHTARAVVLSMAGAKLEQLARAEDRVAEGHRHIARQREFISELHGQGRDDTEAMDVLMPGTVTVLLM